MVGDAALLVDPYSSAAIADAILRVLTDQGLASCLRAKGLARAQDFSWERSVAKTLEIYREVANV